MERGRTEFFRCAGITRLAMLDEAEPTAWTLRKATLEYFRPARVDDLIEVHTGCTALPAHGCRRTRRFFAAARC